MKNEHNLAWLDLEMTGLNPEVDVILEIAMVITDTNLVVLAETPAIAIHHPSEILETMNAWCKEQHGASGLTDRVRQSNVATATAEIAMLDFLKQWIPHNASPLCGNSIHQDRRFLTKYMPTLEQYFHYRNLDVSTLKILAQRWKPEILTHFNKESEHLALADIHDSINELKFYRQHFIKVTTP